METVKFLGASVVSFDSSVGWGDQSSTLRVQLVEDLAQGDEFISEIQIGFPVRFDFNGWIFDGILNEFSQERSTSGNRLINVTLISPTEIVKGVQLILNNIIEDISIPNVYNVFGQVERTYGYGSSLINVFGFPYRGNNGIYNTLLSMINNRPITSKGFQYLLDMSRLPILPDDYRVSGDNISLYDFIEDVCEAASFDFFIELSGNVIVVRTVSRQTQPALGKISEFIEDQTSLGLIVSSSNTGLENEYNISTRLLYGAPKEDIFYSYSQPFDIDTKESFLEDAVTWFWGLDQNGNAIIPFVFEEELKIGENTYREKKISFILNGYLFSFPNPLDNSNTYLVDFRSGYPSDEEEWQAAMSSQEAWESYLVLKDHEGSIHHQKARKIGIVSNTRKDILDFINGKAANPEDFKKLTPMDLFGFENRGDRREEIITHIYQQIKSLADEYYGKKFMVRIPDVLAKIEDNDQVTTSLQPIDSGYVDDSILIENNNPPKTKDIEVQNRYVYLKRFPLNPFVLFNDDGKISCYMKCFSIGVPIDNSSDSYVDDNGYFIKLSVEPDLVFVNRNSVFSPRAVVSSPVFIRDKDAYARDISSSQIYKMLEKIAKNTLGDTPGEDFVKQLFSMSGADMIYSPTEGYAGRPDFVAVPLRNNLKTYGPWYTLGGAGKAEVINDDTIAPWTFGGHYQMNTVARSIVNQSYSERFTGESGSITVVGAPSIRIGAELVASGPYITDINVTVNGSNGVLTTYRMNRWSTNSDKMLRYNIEKLKEITKIRNARKTKIGNFSIARNQTSQKFREIVFPASLQNRSSANLIVGTNIVNSSETKTAVNIMPNYNAARSFGTDETYKNTSAMSIDGLLRPFSTKSNESNLPHFEIDETQTIPSSLNPFRSGNDISFLAHGQSRPTDFSNVNYSDIRALGLKAPVILVGYGYDNSDKPVPNEDPENPTNNFRSDYLTNSRYWKAGPLDVRWDNNEGLWKASGGTKIAIARVTEDVESTYCSGKIVQMLFGAGSGNIRLHNPLAGTPVSSGTITEEYSGDPIFVLLRGMNVVALESPKLGENTYTIIQAGSVYEDCP